MPGSRGATVASLVEPLEASFTKLKPGPGRAAEDVADHQRARIYSAMVEIVAKRGYGAASVREIAGTAGVSTRTFYKLFHSKGDCFLHTYELVVQRAVGRIITSQVGERDWQTRLRLAFRAFAKEIDSEPLAAHLTLIDAPVVGPAARDLTQWAEGTFEAMLSQSLVRIPGGDAMPPLVAKGIVAGISHAARSRVLVGEESDPYAFGDALMEWALCYRCEAAVDLVDLDRQAILERATEAPAVQNRTDEENTQTPMDERVLILAAVAKLAVAEGYGNLTVQRICSAAGVRQKHFTIYFSTLHDCLLEALESRSIEAIEQGARARATADSWEGGVYLAIATLCSRVAQDPLLARLCFVDISLQGEDEGALRCRRFISAFGVALCSGDGLPLRRKDELVISTAMGAIWGLINHYIVAGQAQMVSQIAPVLAFLALAPKVGAQAAVEVIRDEQTRVASLGRTGELVKIENTEPQNLTTAMQGEMLSAASGDASSRKSQLQTVTKVRGIKNES